jgi:hypothetical protein
MKKHAESHFDHGLNDAQRKYFLELFAARDSFFIETVTMPSHLGYVPCGLFGPLMGDTPIPEAEVGYDVRGTRAWQSRLVERTPRQVRQVTVIAGPYEETCGRCGGTGSFYGLAIPPDNGPFNCDCENGTIKHACIVYTMFGGPKAPREPGELRLKRDAAEKARMKYLQDYEYTPDKGPADLSEGYVELTKQRDAIRVEHEESRAFWAEHALAR